jgi:hypothetical protein
LIQSMPFLVFLPMVAFPLAMAGVVVYAGLHAKSRAAVIGKMETSLVAEAETGYVELEGKAEALQGQALEAPFTGAKVCWFSAKLEECLPASGSREPAVWRTLREYTSCEPFLFRDASGICAIFPEGAEVYPTDRSLWYGATALPEDRDPPRIKPSESLEGLLALHGTKGTKFRYREERIYPGDPLYVLGEIASVSTAEVSNVVTNEAEGPDEDGLGPSWESVSRFNRMFAAACAAAPKQIFDGACVDRPFLLSTAPQAEMLDKMTLASKAALGIAAVPLAIAFWLLWARYG